MIQIDKKKSLSFKQKLGTVILAVILVIGGVVYKLADRYLIEHVEVVVADEAAGTADSNNTTGSAETASSSAEVNATSDDWSYSSDDIQIKIDQAQTGSGSDKITYFVADVVLKDASSLKSAFADNSFGTNITEATSEIASSNDAIFAINGDYYGFREDGVIIRNGTVYRDDPVRDAMALFEDGTMQTYNEEEVSSDELLAQGVTNTLSFGPILIQDGQITSDFSSVKIDTNFGNRSIQNANPRTAIGMIAPNHYVFVVVDGRNEGYSRGMTLTELAELMQDLGATEAYNLDGGGSSTMYFMGRVVNNPQGKNQERGVSDILYIKE
ncbi:MULTISPECIES: phosphodiester glycosidase family protein [unclassified Paenibacillus]|uniref:phosphodiester glycosidase family protein n=1 Tax=unclassified Paenibacillus TaxID=185978 RepID=UPI0024075827|nr:MULTISPECIES: phosphodiester glycosidase family protein [unclassified Paenibacillus]MDF9841785.1 exopolysaccharide biosynthesis protein [Paenibacillus sp. PastF-2]MDF9848534.1 exopolysaccharide biosynthesis protein [Paenibacillus sp. PastM-2]MDF9854945.1 exopolysaccharide biosynthesis protein [Paenibacillus sp. PastF-1]MDH6480214.1 exopolysaccharide biosynthesis protein [Paenibacillus sp. PastH-2]MDH6507802.1 exopolysaccharide biosynthesis protein [Paenibacillus sp. PastM-3]